MGIHAISIGPVEPGGIRQVVGPFPGQQARLQPTAPKGCLAHVDKHLETAPGAS
jgi:hypothetical protein